MLLKKGGVIVGNPTTMEACTSTEVMQHSMDLYEENLERHLKQRRLWLWKKATFIARMVIKMASWNQGCILDQDLSDEEDRGSSYCVLH